MNKYLGYGFFLMIAFAALSGSYMFGATSQIPNNYTIDLGDNFKEFTKVMNQTRNMTINCNTSSLINSNIALLNQSLKDLDSCRNVKADYASELRTLRSKSNNISLYRTCIKQLKAKDRNLTKCYNNINSSVIYNNQSLRSYADNATRDLNICKTDLNNIFKTLNKSYGNISI